MNNWAKKNNNILMESDLLRFQNIAFEKKYVCKNKTRIYLKKCTLKKFSHSIFQLSLSPIFQGKNAS